MHECFSLDDIVEYLNDYFNVRKLTSSSPNVVLLEIEGAFFTLSVNTFKVSNFELRYHKDINRDAKAVLYRVRRRLCKLLQNDSNGTDIPFIVEFIDTPYKVVVFERGTISIDAYQLIYGNKNGFKIHWLTDKYLK